MKRVQPLVGGYDAHALLYLLGEELKHTLSAALHTSAVTSTSSVYILQSLKTIDAILTYHRLSADQTQLVFEPVHVGATMQSVFTAMEPLLREKHCSAQLRVQHGLQPVDVDRALLELSLQSLWQGFLQTIDQPAAMTCTARRVRGGVRLSIHSSDAHIEAVHFSQFHSLSTQPLKSIASPAADIVAASGLLSLVDSTLHRTAHRSGAGLGFTLPFSKQLELL